jgi:hypothetical protein
LLRKYSWDAVQKEVETILEAIWVESAKVYIEAFATTNDFKLLLRSIFSLMDRRMRTFIPVRVQSVFSNSSCWGRQLGKYIDCRECIWIFFKIVHEV